MTANLEARLDRAMAACPKCQPLSPDEVAAHRREALRDVQRTQARRLVPLAAGAWPQSRPFRNH